MYPPLSLQYPKRVFEQRKHTDKREPIAFMYDPIFLKHYSPSLIIFCPSQHYQLKWRYNRVFIFIAIYYLIYAFMILCCLLA